jgi:hypothetical protein
MSQFEEVGWGSDTNEDGADDAQGFRARNFKNYTAIGGRSALDLRAEVGVWCMVV